MLEERGNVWEMPGDALCITTNGATRSDGCAIMGRGVAREAAQFFPGLPRELGERLRATGNHVYLLRDGRPTLVSFPVKHHWNERADFALIARSARRLVRLADEKGWHRVLLPRPGCGNGQLRWDDVRPLLARILDDRFIAVTFKEES